MIGLKFIGTDNKPVRILVHEKIYKGHQIENGALHIFFESTPAVKKDKNAVTYNWSFKKAISDILNYSEVEAWLKTVKKPDISQPKHKPGQNQQTLNF